MRLAQFIALLAAALIAGLASTPYGFGGLPAMLVRATVSILLAYLAALFASRLTFRVIHRTRLAEAERHQLAAFGASVTWLVPTFLLLRLSSPWAVVCAITGVSLAVSATRAAWREGGQALSLLTALALQAGILALAIEKLALATAALALATLLVSLRWSIHRPPIDAFRSPLTLAAALLVTAAFLVQTFGIFPNSEPRQTGAVPVYAVSGDSKGKWARTDPGVILYPKVEPKPIEAPPPPSSRKAEQQNNRAKPLEIPFAGVYWYFHPPWREPPPTSVTRQGEPSSFRFRTADRRPIRMHARQHLGRAINLNCCSRLDVVVRNTDPVRRSIELEVELVDSRNGATTSLGRQPILSHPTFTPAASTEAATERLSFPLRAAAQSEFDEFRIAFHLRDLRVSRGAQISIDRFVLVPRSW